MKLRTYLISFGLGCLTYEISNYFKQSESKKKDSHLFEKYLEDKQYKQPSVIDMLHKSNRLHFVNNLILQNTQAINYVKVYLPNQIEQMIQSGTLLGMDFQKKQKLLKLYMVFNTTEQLQGHNGVVHGGLIATLLDNCYSYLSASATGIFPQNPINIHINYRKPIKVNQDYLVCCEITGQSNNIVAMKATIQDSKFNLVTDSTGTFKSLDLSQNVAMLIQQAEQQAERNLLSQKDQ